MNLLLIENASLFSGWSVVWESWALSSVGLVSSKMHGLGLYLVPLFQGPVLHSPKENSQYLARVGDGQVPGWAEWRNTGAPKGSAHKRYCFPTPAGWVSFLNSAKAFFICHSALQIPKFVVFSFPFSLPLWAYVCMSLKKITFLSFQQILAIFSWKSSSSLG